MQPYVLPNINKRTQCIYYVDKSSNRQFHHSSPSEGFHLKQYFLFKSPDGSGDRIKYKLVALYQSLFDYTVRATDGELIFT